MSIGPIPRAFVLQFPLEHFAVGSRFGVHDQWHPNPHRGADYIAPAGTPIHAVGVGRVAAKGRSDCLGNYVITEHRVQPNGKGPILRVFIGSNHMLLPSPVKVGANVKRGQRIGQVGNTGACSQGAHDHTTAALLVTGNGYGPVFDPTDLIESHLPPRDKTIWR